MLQQSNSMDLLRRKVLNTTLQLKYSVREAVVLMLLNGVSAIKQFVKPVYLRVKRVLIYRELTITSEV
jgi:hypothetical protein